MPLIEFLQRNTQKTASVEVIQETELVSGKTEAMGADIKQEQTGK